MNVPAHSHCEICQKTIDEKERFCGSAECEEQHKANIREKKKNAMILVAVLGLAMILYAIGR